MSPHKLSNKALLTLLIGEENTTRLYHGSLHDLFKLYVDYDVALITLAIARELTLRATKEVLERSVISSPKATSDYFKTFFLDKEREMFVCMYLDVRHRVIEVNEMFYGSLTQTSVYPREVLKHGLLINAGAVIFAHNHPSGVAEPSTADFALTQQLKKVLSLVDIEVLDHFVVAAGTTHSFAEHGQL